MWPPWLMRPAPPWCTGRHPKGRVEIVPASAAAREVEEPGRRWDRSGRHPSCGYLEFRARGTTSAGHRRGGSGRSVSASSIVDGAAVTKVDAKEREMEGFYAAAPGPSAVLYRDLHVPVEGTRAMRRRPYRNTTKIVPIGSEQAVRSVAGVGATAPSSPLLPPWTPSSLARVSSSLSVAAGSSASPLRGIGRYVSSRHSGA